MTHQRMRFKNQTDPSYLENRKRVLVTWRAWDSQPSNVSRALARAEAVTAFAGKSANELCRFLAAARRAGVSYDQALNDWEEDW